MLDLAIVVLNWNTRDLLRQCLVSVYASQGGFGCRVCVVDNASTDGSAEMVAAEFPQALLIRNPANTGFASGNNLGLRAFGFDEASPAGPATGPRYVLLLNPDTVLPATALRDMQDYMERHPEVGAAGPKLVLPDNSLDLACRRSFPTPEVAFYRLSGLSHLFPRSPRFGRYNMTHLDPNLEIEVDSVVGAFMLVRAEAIRQAGLLDERFFMYGEDLDWAFRIKQAGWQIRYNPAVTVLHVKRAASRQNPTTTAEFYRAMLLFNDKHYRATTSPLLRRVVVAGIYLRWALAALTARLRPGGSPASGAA